MLYRCFLSYSIFAFIFSFFIFPLFSDNLPVKNNPVILMVETMPVPAVTGHLNSCKAALRELGYIDGKNAQIEVLQAEGDLSRAERLMREYSAEEMPDVVITFATLATKAAKTVFAGTNVPIVFSVVADPVGAGIVKKIDSPTGTHITGLVYTISRKTKLETVLRCLSHSQRDKGITFGVIHSIYPSAEGDYNKLSVLSRNYPKINFVEYSIPYSSVPEGLPDMLEKIPAGIDVLENAIDYWWEPTGPLAEVAAYHQSIREESEKPIAVAQTRQSVKNGALLSILPDWQKGGTETAALAHRILKGEYPGDIPVSIPSTFTMAINLDTAIRINAVIHPHFMEMAAGNIYREKY